MEAGQPELLGEDGGPGVELDVVGPAAAQLEGVAGCQRVAVAEDVALYRR